jgi:TetR/AcrR family fatty acid metabolism transcriptional regulator
VKRKRTLLHPDQRRQQLLDAATWVFARTGFRNASITDIIERAGVARGTFYLYFKSKDDIFRLIVETFHGQTVALLGGMGETPSLPAGHTPRELLAASFLQWLRFVDANRDAATVVLREASTLDARFDKAYTSLRRAAAARLAARFAFLQQRGLASSTLPPELVAHIQLGIFDEVLRTFVLGKPEADLDTLARQLADFEWNGIRGGQA